MVSEISIREYATASNSYIVATNLNLGSTSGVNLNPTIYPIVAGSLSYDKYFKIHFAGTFTSVSDLMFYKSDGAYVTGEVLNYTGQVTTWATPTNGTSANATTALPTSEPTTANVSIGGSLTGSLTAEGDSDFIVLQGSYSANTSASATIDKTFTFDWIET